MSRQLRCPNCGGEHTLVNPGITMMVCEFCSTVVYWDDETSLKTGKQSILPESDSRLFMHATGKLMDKGYEVVGHIRYDHGRGAWDEWYLQIDDGSVAWLSEDERKLSMEQFLAPDPQMPPPSQLQVGMTINMEGVGYTIREIGRATCVGGEGQLPFTVMPGEAYPYADVASLDGSRFGTLEYDEGQTPRCFVGYVLDHSHVTINDERPPSTAGSHEGQNITCPNCSGSLEVPAGREVQTKVCEYCGAQNDLTAAQVQVMGVNPSGIDGGFTFDIGKSGQFLGQPYEVCGRMLYEDDEGYECREYLLFNPDAGYLWLAEENGHYVLNRPTQQAPESDPFYMILKQKVKAGPTEFQFFESGVARLVFVDGALPWQACTGDQTQYADLIAPPQIFGAETDGQEIEYFLGNYMTPEEVYAAFGIEDKPPKGFGVHAAQPFMRSGTTKLLMAIGGIFALLNLGLLFWSLASSGKPIFQKTFQATNYLKESNSELFTVGSGGVMTMRIDAPLSNSWMALDIALMNEKEQVVAEMSNQISYYQGYEGGESWSEGKRRNTEYFRSPPAGKYRMILKAAAGSGVSRAARGEPLTITLKQGVVLSRYFLAAFIITFLYPVFAWMRRRGFEKKRWAEAGSDDDDDDWDDDT